MKKLLDAQQLPGLLQRTHALSPDAQPQWGRLTVSGMLYHCTLIHNQLLAATQSRPPKPKERVLKLLLHVMSKLPQGIKTSDSFLPPAAELLDFDRELASFVAATTCFAQHSAPIWGVHPVFGPLNTTEWRRFAWLHLDHHLRQFGV